VPPVLGKPERPPAHPADDGAHDLRPKLRSDEPLLGDDDDVAPVQRDELRALELDGLADDGAAGGHDELRPRLPAGERALGFEV